MSSLIWPTHFLRYLVRTKNLEMGKVIDVRSIVSSHWSRENKLKTNALVAFYSKTGSAQWGFDQMNKGSIESGLALDFLRLFKLKWISQSYPPNEYVSTFVLTACITVKHVSFGRQCHGYLLKSGLVFHKYVKISLLQLYRMLSDVVGAMEVLVSVPGSDINAYGLFEKEHLDDAYDILRKIMAEEDMVWNKSSYIGVFGLCARLHYRELGRQVHNKLLKSDVEFDVSICNAVVKMYWKCGHLGNALLVFNTCKARNVVTWTTMMAAYSDAKLFEESLILFHHMLCENIAPNESTFSVLLNSSAELFSTRFGNLLHAFAEKTGFKGHTNVEDALISMYLRTGDIKAAEKVFFEMTYRDVETWNMMICGYSLHGFGNESLGLFQEMLNLGEDPDYETFVGVLNACGHVEEGQYYLSEVMKQKGVKPGLEHYRYIMNILIRLGKLDEAYNFMVSTPIKLDGFAWSTWISACDAHRYNISTRLAEFFPDDVAANMSKLSKVKNVGDVIEGGVRNDIKVEPGLSWVEVKQDIYMFDSVFNGHPQFVELHKLVKPLFASIKTYDNVLHDDAKEEDCDGYHSEVVAVACALLKTHEAAPICIIKKSGIICEDCHSLMKLISKARNRVITVRDGNRFHHFFFFF